MAKATTPRRPERIKSAEAALIVGVSSRKILELAAKGEIPGAAKIGKLWTFDEKELREWVRELVDMNARRKSQSRRPIRTGVAIPYVAGQKSRTSSAADAFEQTTRRLLSLASRQSKSAK